MGPKGQRPAFGSEECDMEAGQRSHEPAGIMALQVSERSVEVLREL
jgi:hypothetical protein